MMKMQSPRLQLADSHAHLSDREEAVIARAQAAGVTAIINICTKESDFIQGTKLQEKYPGIFNAAAVHPHDTQGGHAYYETVASYARSGKIVAVGETGLDYHYNHSERSVQQAFLRKHLQLAVECQLPVIIHCREAFDDFFQIISEEYTGVPGVLHCFTGTLEEALKGLSLGWYISFSGVVTFKKSEALREVVKEVPLNRMLIETDAPFLAPQSHRGKPNESAFLVEIAQTVAAVKGIPLEELARVTYENCKTLFRF